MNTREKFQGELINALVWKTCLNCENCNKKAHFDTNIPLCTKYEQTPPASVIVNGCVSWVADIPF